jgi:hypothetical protein
MLQKKNGNYGAESVLCVAVCEKMNQLFLFSGPSGDNFRVIPHLQQHQAWVQQFQSTGYVDSDCVEGVAKETENEALSSTLGAGSSIILVHHENVLQLSPLSETADTNA